MKGKARAELRAEAHHLDPMIHVGHQGMTDTVREAINDALRTHELVKIAISGTLETRPKVFAGEVAESLGAQVIQSIGRKITLYRHNPELWERGRKAPPWKS